MTASNHALTGAVIALAVKRPELAIPLAFLSHFVLDTIPHYNPPGITKSSFINLQTSWQKKAKSSDFLITFPLDMTLLMLVLILIPLHAPTAVSPWTIFFSSFVAITPDFEGGIHWLLSLVGVKITHVDRFTRFHVWIQWLERPWGIWVELVWAVAMVVIIYKVL